MHVTLKPKQKTFQSTIYLLQLHVPGSRLKEGGIIFLPVLNAICIYIFTKHIQYETFIFHVFIISQYLTIDPSIYNSSKKY